MAVILLCICYGVRRLHGPQGTRTPQGANPSRPPSTSSLQRAASIKGKSPSFLQSPLATSPGPHLDRPHPAVDTPHFPMTTRPDVAVISLAQISTIPLSSVAPSSLSHTPQTIPRGLNPHHHVTSSHHAPSKKDKPLPPLLLEPIHGPSHSPVVVRGQKTPRSASVEFQSSLRAPRSASTEFYCQNSCSRVYTEVKDKRKAPPRLSDGGSALGGSNASVAMASKTSTAASSTLTARSTEV